MPPLKPPVSDIDASIAGRWGLISKLSRSQFALAALPSPAVGFCDPLRFWNRLLGWVHRQKPVLRPLSDAEARSSPSSEEMPWSTAVNLSNSSTDSRSPAVALAPDGTVHVLWEEGEEIYHSHRSNAGWSSPVRVATGERPTLVVDGNGTVHALFANEFGGNWEIYYVYLAGGHWTLPRNISYTSGASGMPRLALAPDGLLHAVWADTTPGYSVIYHGQQQGPYWINQPIPNARGSVPALAVDGQGRLHVVWQDQDTPASPFEIYYSRRDGQEWSLPENISASASAQSAIADLSLDAQGTAYLVWEEETGGGWQIYHSYGRVGYWSVPADISQSPNACHLARVVITPQQVMHVAWEEGTVLRSRHKGAQAGEWFPTETIASNPLGLGDVALATAADGRVHAVWAARMAGGQRDIFHSERPSALKHKIIFPIVMRDD